MYRATEELVVDLKNGMVEPHTHLNIGKRASSGKGGLRTPLKVCEARMKIENGIGEYGRGGVTIVVWNASFLSFHNRDGLHSTTLLDTQAPKAP